MKKSSLTSVRSARKILFPKFVFRKCTLFTLIELLAVIIILGIIMLIAIPSISRYINNSRKYKISFRANEYVDVSQVASKFAGGGHLRAAGFELSGDIEQIKQTVVEEIKKQLK